MRRPPAGVSLAFLSAPRLDRAARRQGELRAFVGGFLLALVLALIAWGAL